MARLPSFDSQIEKAKVDLRNVQALSSRLADTIGTLPETGPDAAFQPEMSRMTELHALEASLEADFLRIVDGFGTRTDSAYATFDRVEDVTRHEKFVAFFTGRKAASLKAVRLKKLAVAETLKVILLEAAVIQSLLQARKETAAALLSAAEPKLVASMERRRHVVSSIDGARQRDKALAASLATLQRKIAGASDETRLGEWKAEERETQARHDAVLSERKRLARDHDVLDRQALLLGDLIDLMNDKISVYTSLTNKLNIEAERCMQLYDAAAGTLEPLLAEAQPHLSDAVGDASPMPLGVFRELLRLHAQGSVSMQDIERRKKRVDEALARRRDPASAGRA